MASLLLVDDDQDLVDTLREFFELQEHQIECATSAAAALCFMAANRYDLIMLDWRLPDMEGIEVCRQYRQKGGVDRIVMLTGMRDELSRRQGQEAGVDAFLIKPFTVAQLSDCITENLKALSS
jgi:OmpR-family two-component system manganese-sensing response regulator